MRQTTEQLPYVGSTAVRSHCSQNPIRRCMGRRHGFTLIEVVVAMAILMIAVIGLVGSYGSYYSRVSAERITTIGQNFAQLLLEDAEGLSDAQLAALVASSPSYAGSANYPLINYPPNVATTSGVYDSGSPDPADTGNQSSWNISALQATYIVEPVWTISGQSPSNASGPIPDITVPSGMIVPNVYNYGNLSNPQYVYSITVNKDVYPGFKKRIQINAVGTYSFRITVTIFWKVRGIVQKCVLSTVR